MNTDVMMDRISATSLRVKAGIAGLLYLLTILTGIFAQGFGERQACGRRRRRSDGDQHTDSQGLVLSWVSLSISSK